MTLEEFEKELAQGREREDKSGQVGKESRQRHHQSHRPEHNHHHRRKRKHDSADDERGHRRTKHKHHHRTSNEGPLNEGPSNQSDDDAAPQAAAPTSSEGDQLRRDSWMEVPSALEFDYTQKGIRKPQEEKTGASSRRDFQLKIHDNELNKHHLQSLADGGIGPEDDNDAVSTKEVDYVFGDTGSQWRMKKLKRVYERAEESGRHIDDVAMEHFGDLAGFDEAREEQTELDRRSTYGDGYVGKEKPTGEIFRARERAAEIERKAQTTLRGDAESVESPQVQTALIPTSTISLDQTALNRLKARMMKAKIRGGPEAEALETEYTSAMAGFANAKQADVVVIPTMENRLLAGNRSGEVKTVDNKRGRERGLVVENEDMSIEDMVREERRTKGAAGGDGRRFAERIAKDAKFDNDLDYMDENAAKLARRVQKSEMNLKNTAISDFQKMNRILDTCPLCHHEDTNTPPVAPLVSLATRVYLTLPTEPEISDGGACIVPIQHRGNLLECDDDEWEEIRNFMKSLTRLYHDQGRSVVFYENASSASRKRHAAMEVVPLPYSLGATAPAFFKEAILTADEEWTQHKKLIDTLAKAKSGLGKRAFRMTLVKEIPYFHVWFEVDGGLGHIIEDANRWPKGDLFAREVIGGMLDRGPEIVKKQGRWQKGDRRVDGFRKGWKKFDWTRVLTDQ